MRAIKSNEFEKKFLTPPKKMVDYILVQDKTFDVAEGPVRSSKTTNNIIKFADRVERSSERVFLAIGQTQSTAKAILFDGDGLGLQHYKDWQEKKFNINGKIVKRRQRVFKGKYEGYDALILLPKKGSGHGTKYIVAFGGANKDSHEPYKGWSVGGVIATQYELLHANTRAEIIKRTIASKDRFHILDLNPTAPGHELYKDIDRWMAEGSVNYVHTTMLDNPIMTEERIAEIIKEYDPDSVDYKRDILGQRVAAEGIIYRVTEANIIDGFNANDYYQYVVVADPGVNHSATSFILMAITHDRKNIDVLMSYYHKNSDKEGMAIKMPTDYALDYIEFIKSAIKTMGKPPMEVLSDLDVTFLREFERIKYANELGGININKSFKKLEIHQRIKMGINYLWKERLRFNAECKEVIEAFKTARYDEKEKDKGNYQRYDKPNEGTMIDPIDAVEYGFTRLRYEIDKWVG